MATKARTIQDVYDEMSEDKKDLLKIILGTVKENTNLSGNVDIVKRYNALSQEHKNLIDYSVGSMLELDKRVEHSDLQVGEFLAHFGVKGMKWGVRRERDKSSGPRPSDNLLNVRSERAIARAKVKRGVGTLKDAHMAGLKSTGHRVVNGLTGDKTFWKDEAKVLAAAGLTFGTAMAAAYGLPDSVLSSFGDKAPQVILGKDNQLLVFSSDKFKAQASLISAGMAGASGISTVGRGRNFITNTARAVRGNERVRKSFDSISERAHQNQKSGNKQVRKVLNESGSISKKNLKLDKNQKTVKHSQSEVASFLKHYDIDHLGQGK